MNIRIWGVWLGWIRAKVVIRQILQYLAKVGRRTVDGIAPPTLAEIYTPEQLFQIELTGLVISHRLHFRHSRFHLIGAVNDGQAGSPDGFPHRHQRMLVANSGVDRVGVNLAGSRVS